MHEPFAKANKSKSLPGIPLAQVTLQEDGSQELGSDTVFNGYIWKNNK